MWNAERKVQVPTLIQLTRVLYESFSRNDLIIIETFVGPKLYNYNERSQSVFQLKFVRFYVPTTRPSI